MKAVITAILEDDIGSREADGPFTSNRVQPLDAVTWALGLLGIEPPPELVDAAIRKRRKLAAAEALLASGRDPAQGSSPQDDEPVPLPPKLTPENRSSFAALVAFRYARIPVSGAPGVAQLGELGVKAPLPRYIAPSGHYSIGFDELAEWADAVPGRWARVLDALRLWTGPGGAAAAD